MVTSQKHDHRQQLCCEVICIDCRYLLMSCEAQEHERETDHRVLMHTREEP
jgi:hypothetical protein